MTKTIMLIAGEASGDHYGAALMTSLKKQSKDALMFIGVGGESMEKEGLVSTFSMKELSHMGIVEILPHLPNLYKRLRELVDLAESKKPDVLVTIDCPEFSLRVAKRLHYLPMPLIHCVAPSVWAWRPGRAKKMAGFLDHLITLFPFEPPYFLKHGLSATFCGHPISQQPLGSAKTFLKTCPWTAKEKMVLLLPGSRTGEVERLLPLMLAACRKLKETDSALRFGIVTYPAVTQAIKTLVGEDGAFHLIDHAQKWDAFAAAHMALAASGTVTLELAHAGVPMVVLYKFSALTGMLGRMLIQSPWGSLVNILANKAVVEELIQEDCTEESIIKASRTLLSHKEARDKQKATFNHLRFQLQPPGGGTPSDLAAAVILNRIICPLNDYRRLPVGSSSV